MRLPVDSIRLRLSLWYAALLAVGLLAMAGATYSLLDNLVTRRATQTELETGATLLAAARRDSADLVEAVNGFRAPDRRVLLFGPGGELRAASRPGRFGPRTAEEVFVSVDAAAILRAARAQPPGRRPTSTLMTLRPGDPPVRVTALRRWGSQEAVLAVIGSTGSERLLREQARRALALAVLLTLGIAVIPGSLLVRRSLAPIGELTRRAAQIGAERLGDRLPVGNPRDELGLLASVLNDLLDRLQSAFAQQRRFMAEAAHELRTPIAVVRAETELALSGERGAAEYREALGVVGGESERLARIVDDLLTFSRVEAGQHPLRLSQTDLGEVATDAARSLRALAAARGVTISAQVTDELPMRADADLIGRMVTNLVENAVKHGRPGDRITVDAEADGGEYRLRVRDTGPGVPVEARTRIFEPFFRGSQARAEGGSAGAGLGLPIARWIAEAHGGRLELTESGPSGSVFVATLPASAAPTAS